MYVHFYWQYITNNGYLLCQWFRITNMNIQDKINTIQDWWSSWVEQSCEPFLMLVYPFWKLKYKKSTYRYFTTVVNRRVIPPQLNNRLCLSVSRWCTLHKTTYKTHQTPWFLKKNEKNTGFYCSRKHPSCRRIHIFWIETHKCGEDKYWKILPKHSKLKKMLGKVRLSLVKYYKIEIFLYVFTYKYGQ